MSTSAIVLIVMGVALLGWVVACAVHFLRSGRALLCASGLTAHLTCESCGSTFDLPAGELADMWFSKSASVTRTRREGAAMVDEPTYRSFAKKVTCPQCGERVWAQVQNVNEINASLRGAYLASGLKHIGLMLAGGFLILLAAQLVLTVLRALGLQ
ncbi:hypothetical protein [Collinsella sp. An307]|uniref:hypothetical protein n=1 Tax=Collinsella sp. An307 TaxID=1965630 RepID=UPI000B38BD1E|nr:hypothetical protein [Collinsella sp. An307]OUO20810.1 hypothetical protein B5F89_04565 [Collinsella sp. An307]